jgi:hypothetical protein
MFLSVGTKNSLECREEDDCSWLGPILVGRMLIIVLDTGSVGIPPPVAAAFSRLALEEARFLMRGRVVVSGTPS